jgi:hypothetical protein
MNEDNQKSPTKPRWDYTEMSAIEYAAIHTGQPVSGTPWLDDMIRAQRRERLAGQALAGMDLLETDESSAASWSVEAADAIITALEGGAKVTG